MRTESYLLTTTPPQQTVGVARRITPYHRFRRRLPCENLRQKSTGKELDRETCLYYFGARYLDPRTSRWLSPDPAIWEGDFLPSAPNSEQARRGNANLPNGGVFNPINLHVFNYANNNPVRYVDPDGRIPAVTESWLVDSGGGGERLRAEISNIFGVTARYGLAAEAGINLGGLLRLKIGVDVLGFGQIGAEISRTAPAVDGDSLFDHIKNVWQNGETRINPEGSISVRGASLTANSGNDLKLEVGVQLGIRFKAWINLTEAKNLVNHAVGQIRTIFD